MLENCKSVSDSLKLLRKTFLFEISIKRMLYSHSTLLFSIVKIIPKEVLL